MPRPSAAVTFKHHDPDAHGRQHRRRHRGHIDGGTQQTGIAADRHLRRGHRQPGHRRPRRRARRQRRAGADRRAQTASATNPALDAALPTTRSTAGDRRPAASRATTSRAPPTTAPTFRPRRVRGVASRARVTSPRRIDVVDAIRRPDCRCARRWPRRQHRGRATPSRSTPRSTPSDVDGSALVDRERRHDRRRHRRRWRRRHQIDAFDLSAARACST